MTWLTIQTIAWCLVGFAVGALAAWLVAVMLFPHEAQVAAPGAGESQVDGSSAADGAPAGEAGDGA
ncbi:MULTISPECIES: hypothetical protein [Yimella]|uniref:Uncharacterized protein n=1 Tax=Yimella lutea TaxID=587872 RepID=A0A542ECQ3_9MICO|nr:MULTISPECIES: hypothetical protein [Yimella]MCG8656657.1 hypothetical protein [Yimella sp. NH-Cas1]TQJ13108.1 hypothetical protein FB459_0505 [Yimella lutea]